MATPTTTTTGVAVTSPSTTLARTAAVVSTTAPAVVTNPNPNAVNSVAAFNPTTSQVQVRRRFLAPSPQPAAP